MRALSTLAVAALLASPLSVAAGSLDQPEITDYRIWESTRCYKPRPPAVQISDPLTFKLAIEGFNQYIAHMRRYLECAEQEANEDYASIKRVLEQGLARVRGTAVTKLEETRDRIEKYRPLYAPPPQSAGLPGEQE